MKYYGFCGECGKVVEAMVRKEDRPQGRIYMAVAERGYTAGWTAEQFLARQAAKLMEELGEVFALMDGMPVNLVEKVRDAAEAARRQFDDMTAWDRVNVEGGKLEALWKELADLQVVLACAAHTVNYLEWTDRDLMDAALEKADGDVKRGVR